MANTSSFTETLRDWYRAWKRVEWRIRCVFKTYIVARRFPFDTSRPLPANAHERLAECCDALEHAGIRYTLGWGTALGIYRDKRLIPHDNDFDINLIDVRDRASVERIMTDLGWTLGRRVITRPRMFGPKSIQQLVFYSPDHIDVDYFFWDTTQKGPVLRNFMDADYIVEQPRRFFEEFGSVEFHGRRYPVARDIEGYLASIYGSDWNIPRGSKGTDWRVGCHCLVKRKKRAR